MFFFLQFDLPAHIYSFSFTKTSKPYKKKYENIHFAIYVAQKNPYAMLKNATNKTFFSFSFWASILTIYYF